MKTISATNTIFEKLPIHNRLDLIKLVYTESKRFLKIPDVMDMGSIYNHIEIVKYLSGKGASCSRGGFDHAARYGNLQVVKWLHENRPQDSSKYCSVALAYAAKRGHFEVVEYLVKNVIGIKYINEAISNAVGKGHLSIAKYLRELLPVLGPVELNETI